MAAWGCELFHRTKTYEKPPYLALGAIVVSFHVLDRKSM
jgi:hypothetical protein